MHPDRCFARALLSVSFAAVALFGLPVTAQSSTTGPVAFHNATSRDVRIEAHDCVPENEGLRGAVWQIEAGHTTYLGLQGQKFRARQFRAWITTSGGSTYWAWKCTQLDGDGDFVMEFAPANLREHYRILSERPVLGIDMGAHAEGVAVVSLSEDSPARRAGLVAGDVITALDDERVKTGEELTNVLWSKKKPGQVVEVTFSRGGRTQRVHATLRAAAQALPDGPSERAVQSALVKAVTATAAWAVAREVYNQPSDNLLEEAAKEIVFELAKSALREAMASAVGDLAPNVGARDRTLLANILIEAVTGEGRVFGRGTNSGAVLRLLQDQGMRRSDAAFFADAVALMVGRMQSANR